MPRSRCRPAELQPAKPSREERTVGESGPTKLKCLPHHATRSARPPEFTTWLRQARLAALKPPPEQKRKDLDDGLALMFTLIEGLSDYC